MSLIGCPFFYLFERTPFRLWTLEAELTIADFSRGGTRWNDLLKSPREEPPSSGTRLFIPSAGLFYQRSHLSPTPAPEDHTIRVFDLSVMGPTSDGTKMDSYSRNESMIVTKSWYVTRSSVSRLSQCQSRVLIPAKISCFVMPNIRFDHNGPPTGSLPDKCEGVFKIFESLYLVVVVPPL